ncbi:MAG: hypothetical protein KA715_08010 [Xanthomonadaceae bacterium]|nr:hypothetical protein [Xanthomonadaceae bacterium]
MSATRDQSQKFTFVFSNMYSLYKKGQEAVRNTGGETARILKVDDLRKSRIEPYKPVELISKRVQESTGAAVQSVSIVQARDQAVATLKSNLDELQDLQKRLRFMLKDLEVLVGPKKEK